MTTEGPATPAGATTTLERPTAREDDPPATTMANLFKQRASPIRFFIVIIVWAIGVVIVGVDTRRRTTPQAPPTPAPAAPTASAP
jgi:hypothetical protein